MQKPEQPAHKNIFFSCEGLRKYFLPAHGEIHFLLNLFQDVLS